MIWLLVIAISLPGWSWAQEETASRLNRYREQEMSTRHYEKYEVRPLARPQIFVGEEPTGVGAVTLAPTAERVRIRTHLADSHMGLKFYDRLTCLECHPGAAQNFHTARTDITCRQCHGPEPIASIRHYYSIMNPIRRHAYVCAKCHPEATASYAEYIVHEPSPASLDTLKTFPVLFVVFWIMVAIAVGTFAAFLPHAFVWGLREFLDVRRKKGR